MDNEFESERVIDKESAILMTTDRKTNIDYASNKSIELKSQL